MQVNSVHVDQINAERPSGAVRQSVRYEFNEPTWVSSDPDQDGKRLGPLTMLEPFEDDRELADVSVTEFPESRLATEDGRNGPEISYTERWTMPWGTVYALVLPEGFVPDNMTMTHLREGSEREMDPRVGVTPDGHLFYHELTDVEAIFDLEVRLEYNPERCDELVENVDVVRGTDRWDDLRDMVAGRTPSANGWMLLLELRKLLGMP